MDTKKFEQLKKNGFDRLSTEDIVTLTPEQAKKLREFLELKLSEQLEHLSMEGKESKMAMYCSALSRIIEEKSGNSLSFTLMEAIGELSVKCYHIGQEEERKKPGWN